MQERAMAAKAARAAMSWLMPTGLARCGDGVSLAASR